MRKNCHQFSNLASVISAKPVFSKSDIKLALFERFFFNLCSLSYSLHCRKAIYEGDEFFEHL